MSYILANELDIPKWSVAPDTPCARLPLLLWQWTSKGAISSCFSIPCWAHCTSPYLCGRPRPAVTRQSIVPLHCRKAARSHLYFVNDRLAWRCPVSPSSSGIKTNGRWQEKRSPSLHAGPTSTPTLRPLGPTGWSSRSPSSSSSSPTTHWTNTAM